MIFSTSSIRKTVEITDGKITLNTVENLLTGEKFVLDSAAEFSISFYKNEHIARRRLFRHDPIEVDSSAATARFIDDGIVMEVEGEGVSFTVTEKFSSDHDVLKKDVTITSSTPDVFIANFCAESHPVSEEFSWSRPIVDEVVTISPYILSLGQPVYNGTIFSAFRSPVGDNYIEDGLTRSEYHFGRTVRQCGGCVTPPPFIIGASHSPDMIAARSAFFNYVHTFSRQPSVYITFNSWYDYMLDIDSDKITSSFNAIHDGFTSSGLRDIDCYVIDDGWADYKAKKLWSVDESRFTPDFSAESALTKSFNSHFGLWLGPRGGYTAETPRYGKRLKSIGYNFNLASQDVCTGDPNYIKDLGDRLIWFMRNSNVSYYKLDGFALKPCSSTRHGHPVGGKDGVYFYTYLWEEWIKVFKRMKEVNPDVFINLTSYAHCSSFFLEYASAIWMNNAGDMSYVGRGSDLDQCLNYRDGRYYNLQYERQVQLPPQYIYNHEPNYGKKNYNPPLPDKTHRTVKYTDEEFEKYLYSCLMRGSGFIELYYTPEMMSEGDKYAVNARVLKWVEDNFSVISDSTYFGGLPEKEEVYGYIGTDGNRAIVSFRNPSPDRAQSFSLDLSKYTFNDGLYDCNEHYPATSEKILSQGSLTVTLSPSEVKIFEIQYKD